MSGRWTPRLVDVLVCQYPHVGASAELRSELRAIGADSGLTFTQLSLHKKAFALGLNAPKFKLPPGAVRGKRCNAAWTPERREMVARDYPAQGIRGGLMVRLNALDGPPVTRGMLKAYVGKRKIRTRPAPKPTPRPAQVAGSLPNVIPLRLDPVDARWLTALRWGLDNPSIAKVPDTDDRAVILAAVNMGRIRAGLPPYRITDCIVRRSIAA
jgi:hypothetical protein